MQKAISNFSKYTLSEFRKQIASILAGMKGNDDFLLLHPQVAALSTLADTYYELDNGAEGGSIKMMLARNTARKHLADLLEQIGFGVSWVCNGDCQMLASSGFPFNKMPEKSAPLVKPEPARVSKGVNEGTINVKITGQRSALSYKCYIAAVQTQLPNREADDLAWQVISYNQTRFSFTDLTVCQKYLFKVGIVGPRGQEVVSEPVGYIAT